jgi:ribose transport system substrate-binding protein
MSDPRLGLDRRRFLLGAGALGATAALAACTGDDDDSANNVAAPAGAGSQQTGRPVTLGFSAPQADHGWILAITTLAKARADQYPDVTLRSAAATNDVNVQISEVQALIDAGVDALVILPFDGNALTEIGRSAMQAGIPVVNLDRIFADPLAYRTYYGGDNYGVGVNAGNYIGRRLKDAGAGGDAVIVEVQGIAALELVKQRSQGFADALQTHGYRVTARQAAEFTVESGQEVMANLLEANPRIDAVFNQDDDQGIGVLAAIEDAGRDEFFMVGTGGSLDMMEHIQADDTVVKATALYSPIMSASAVSVARLIAQTRGMGDLPELAVPQTIIAYSDVVTKDNVANYMKIGYRS